MSVVALTTVLSATPALGPFFATAPAAAVSSGRAVQAAAATSMFPLFLRRTSDGHLLVYEPKGTAAGGIKGGLDLGAGFSAATALLRADVSARGRSDLYFRLAGSLYYTAERGTETKLISAGWDQYNLLMSPGNLGGTSTPDILARDAAGALWLVQGRSDGTLAARVQVAASGWNSMNALAGYGDYTGDGKNDLLARTTDGILYIYPGTGSATANTVLGSRISAGTTWSAYTALVSTGDNNADGKADLIACDTDGALWLFKGTGVSSAPFAARVQIAASGCKGANAYF
ncbi:FG-GAP-like repeat-containing protein [Nonomuraea angiospora]|uniref:FG-GAP-like repeat-containing protein n=1 Tax=Nonomuraea angiospora TaxID=46172 RepID=UPI0029BD57A7|nr:FG-GAP-like repeat-containing protein [Nonomuraea angiospora]MDX3109851.1 hypothetical protein [Nonomuraea angiospora]